MILFSSQTFAAKYVALTFDDWPNPKTTPQVLSILKKNNIHATFFVLWQNANKSPDLLKTMVENWHQIWNHSYSHAWLTKIPFSQAEKEINSTNKIIENSIWISPTFWRPPGGFWSPQLQKMAWMKLAMWTIDTKDRQHKNPVKTLANVKANLKDGSIILMHDIHPTSVQALPNVIAYIKSQGYDFVTIEQLAKISPSSFKTKNYNLKVENQNIDSIIETNSSSEIISFSSNSIDFTKLNLPQRFEVILDYINQKNI